MAEHSALLCKGLTASNCTFGTSNPENFTTLKSLDWEQSHIVSIKINEKGIDPGTLLHFKLITITYESSSYQVFHSFYEETAIKTKNLFLSLVESIA
jgi:hypothetical protein